MPLRSNLPLLSLFSFLSLLYEVGKLLYKCYFWGLQSAAKIFSFIAVLLKETVGLCYHFIIVSDLIGRSFISSNDWWMSYWSFLQVNWITVMPHLKNLSFRRAKLCRPIGFLAVLDSRYIGPYFQRGSSLLCWDECSPIYHTNNYYRLSIHH